MNVQCAVPFVELFTSSTGGFRNCCAAAPQITSKPDQSVMQWWTSDELNGFRQKMLATSLPKDCHGCEIQEKSQGSSMRTATNKEVDWNRYDSRYPSRWNVIFGNICNLACWTCSENSSSLIEAHKKKIGMLSASWPSTQDAFLRHWPSLKDTILTSYQHHDVIAITILGGEPLYNKTVIDFLQYLVENNLSTRTRLEFHTNATKMSSTIRQILTSGTWNYVCIFLSLDAIGKKAEWLRYGCDWSQIVGNIAALRASADYCEVHCALSVLNVGDLPKLQEFCEQQRLPLRVNLISKPGFMSLEHWDGAVSDLVPAAMISDGNYKHYIDLIGLDSHEGSKKLLRDHIKRFDTVRKPLKDFDSRLSGVLDL
jgi:sulfatase maturation enzyme AslB (radical SAM superfamily)